MDVFLSLDCVIYNPVKEMDETIRHSECSGLCEMYDHENVFGDCKLLPGHKHTVSDHEVH